VFWATWFARYATIRGHHQNRGSRAISLAQRKPAHLIEDQCAVHNPVHEGEKISIKENRRRMYEFFH